MVVKKDETQDDLITTNQNDLNDAEAENINGTEWVGYTIEVNLFIVKGHNFLHFWLRRQKSLRFILSKNMMLEHSNKAVGILVLMII